MTSAANDPLLERLRAATTGEYEIVRELGRGGFAAVYLARDLALDRDVAIKVLIPQTRPDDAEVAAEVERFRREARTVAKLNHPHVIPVYAVRSGDGLQYFVMKFIRGRSLEGVLTTNGRLPLSLVQTILQQTGSALAYAHKNGVVHRDIKPANIMLDEEGWAVVADFGIAKVARADKLTGTGLIVGTAAYMSPEQWAGQEVTGVSDEYSLGCVAYELLTGIPPFRGESITAMLWSHLNEIPTPISAQREDVPAPLERIVMRMMEKEPSARFASMDEAVAAIGALAITESAEETRTQLMSLATALTGAATVKAEASGERVISGGAHAPIMPSGKVSRLSVSPAMATVTSGANIRLTATPLNETGRQLARRATAWRSLDPHIATVDADGVITARSTGSTEVVATCEGVEIRVPVTVSGAITEPSSDTGTRAGTVNRTRRLVGIAALVVVAGGIAWAGGAFAPRDAARGSDVTQSDPLVGASGPANAGNVAARTTDSASVGTSDAPDIPASAAVGSVPAATAAGRAAVPNTNERKDVVKSPSTAPSTEAPAAVPTTPPVNVPDTKADAAAGNVSTPTSTAANPGPATTSAAETDAAPANPMVEISAGATETCAAMSSGDKVLCWGASNPAGSALSDVYFEKLAVGGGHTCGLTPEGAAFCWGDNSQGQLGDNSRAARAAPTAVQSKTRFADISVGAAHTCALAADGSAWCWGSNKAGQLGDNSINNRLVPVLVRGSEKFQSLSAGGSHTCGVRAAKLYCWGDGFSGQIGNAMQENQREPFPVRIATAFRSVVTGDLHTCGLTTAGRAWCWGDNRRGQLGNDTHDNRDVPDSVATDLVFTQLAAGAGHTCGITSTRALACWGENGSGQLGTGSRQRSEVPVVIMRGTSWKKVSAGAAHTCAITRTDAVYCWGANSKGQIGSGTAGGNVLVPTRIAIAPRS